MEKFSRTTSVFFFRFYILCENFSEIGPIIKKIPKFLDNPLKYFIGPITLFFANNYVTEYLSNIPLCLAGIVG